MNRRNFLTFSALSTLGFSSFAKKLKIAEDHSVPAMFIGHGSPMNAIELNQFSSAQIDFGKNFEIKKPKAILMISAHWVTSGLQIQSASQPKIIHDFSGFPKELQQFKYSASGSPNFAKQTSTILKAHHSILTDDWGLDHGAWSVLTRLFPKADVPVFQISLNKNLTLSEHFNIAKELSSLRKKGVMIIGSGNIVHNLRLTDLKVEKPYEWAVEFDEWFRDKIIKKNFKSLCSFDSIKENIVKLAHPTIEHYLPVLYALAVASDQEKITFPITGFQERSISMRSFLIS